MFQFNKEHTLKNEIAELFPLKKEHTAELFEASNDKEIWEHFTENGFGNDKFEMYIERALKMRNPNVEYPLVIRDIRNDKIAGLTRMYAIDNELRM